MYFKMPVLMFLLVLCLGSGAILAQELPEFPGKIAYIGDSYNVYVYDGTSKQTIQHTDDASRSRRYLWPTWSTDGRVAYFCCDFQFSSEIALEVYISSDGEENAKLIYNADNEGFTYAYWSPTNCPDDDRCRELSVLISQITGPFKVELIRDGAAPRSESVGEGAPFYQSWRYDGQQMAWQRNTSLLSIYDRLSETTDDLPFMNGNAQVPLFSPVANELLLAVLNEETNSTDLIVLAEDGVRELQTDLQGVLWLSWSPDGDYVAYSTVRDGQGALVILDAVTGEFIDILSPAQVVSFFWSPDSQKIAYLTPSQVSTQGASLAYQPTEIRLAWSILDVQSGLSRTFEGFTPSAEMIYLISFFDQFAPSHSLWSPDSQYLVYSEVVNGVENQISILDTTAERPVPYPLAEGVIGIWSFE